MNTTAILAFVATGVTIIQELIQLGAKAADIIAATKAFHAKVKQLIDENRAPTDAERAELHRLLAQDTAALETDPPAPPVGANDAVAQPTTSPPPGGSDNGA